MVSAYIITEVRSYRDALERALVGTGRVQVVGAAEHPLPALSELESLQPNVALLDLPGPEGPVWVREIGLVAPATRVLALGLGDAEGEIVALAESGVAGYLGRDASLEDLIEAVEGVARNEAPCHPRTAAILLRRMAAGPAMPVSTWQCGRHLTDREREILQLIGEGLSNHQIARRLCIALATVKNHVHNILEKIGVHRRAEAVREVRRLGFVHQELVGAVDGGRD
jgi:two-component system nitrate/nitrite response regulator NarL